jgi:hypothetical protein
MNRGSDGVIRKRHGTRPGKLLPHLPFLAFSCKLVRLKTSEALRATA